jgi:hypothetical protein
MRLGTAPLLECRPVFHSRDVDETRAWLRRKEFQFDVLGRPTARPDVRMNGVYLPGMYLGYLQYGVKTMIRAAPARNDYWVQMPICGSLEATFGRDSIACSTHRAVVLSPTRDDYYSMRSDAGGARIHLCIDREALLGQLAALLGEPVDQLIEFEPGLTLTSGYGRSLAGYLLMAAADFEQPHATLRNPIMMTMFEQFIMTGLLLGHPHSCSDRLRQREKPISPRDVKRAVDYMETNLDVPMTLADISPMRYLRNARFQRAHEALRAASADASVTEIAMHCGFTHMGRFSVEYRKRFGETPSKTLRLRG